MKTKYGYMIKSVDISEDGKYGIGYGGFKYPLKKNAKIVAKDWNNREECNGGIFGLIHETKEHYIQNKALWLILKYKKGTEIVVNNEKIKVPYAWIVDWGDKARMQQVFKELTGKEYTYNYTFKHSNNDNQEQLAYDYSIQIAGCSSKQISRNYSLQVANNNSFQTADYHNIQISCNDSIQDAGDYNTQIVNSYSTQTAGTGSTQIAGYSSNQLAGNNSKQIARDESTQSAGYCSIQIAGCYSTQTACTGSVQISEHNSKQITNDESIQISRNFSSQSAGKGSVSIIKGRVCNCQHKGKVLQVLCFFDDKYKNDYIFLVKVINDGKKHRLYAVFENEEWVLKDTIIE